VTYVTDAPAKTAAPNRARLLILRSIVGSLIGAALVAVVSVLVGEFGELSWRLLGTVGLFVLFSLMSWYDAEVSAKRATWFGFASAGVSVYLFAAGMLKIWFPAASSGPIVDFLAWAWLVLVARIALLHVHLLILQQTKFTTPVMSMVTKATFGLVVILAAMLSLPALLPHLDYAELYWRILFAVAILDVLGTVLIPLVYVLFHRPARPAQPYHPVATPVYPTQQGFPQATFAEPAPQASPVPPTAPQTAQQPAAPHPAVPHPAATGGFIAPNAAPAVPPVEPFAAPAAQPMQLEWPRYTNGQPVPALPDGQPDLTAPAGALAWPRYVNGQPVPALPDGNPDLSATLR
jgi:hypothetical protein